jgi:hypothetical protein
MQERLHLCLLLLPAHPIAFCIRTRIVSEGAGGKEK